jgi:plasmid maintenance system antidote protein VapI
MKEAVQSLMHKPVRKALVKRRAGTEFHKTLVKRRASTEFQELRDRDDIPREILAELASEKLKAQQEQEKDEQEYLQQLRKEEEHKVNRGRHERKSRPPRKCVERRPAAHSIPFAGEYINLTAIAATSGVGANDISRILSGKRKLSLDVAQKVSAALGMGLEDFINALDRHTALQHGLRRRGLTDAEISYTISEGWKRGLKPPGL